MLESELDPDSLQLPFSLLLFEMNPSPHLDPADFLTVPLRKP